MSRHRRLRRDGRRCRRHHPALGIEMFFRVVGDGGSTNLRANFCNWKGSKEYMETFCARIKNRQKRHRIGMACAHSPSALSLLQQFENKNQEIFPITSHLPSHCVENIQARIKFAREIMRILNSANFSGSRAHSLQRVSCLTAPPRR